MTARHWFALGALLAGTGVALGAFGAHALADRLSPARLGTFETAVRYQVYHGLAIMGTALAADRWPRAWRGSAGLLAAGAMVFSGSLYALVLTGSRTWGAVAPIGGACLLIGWGVLAWSAFRSADSEP